MTILHNDPTMNDPKTVELRRKAAAALRKAADMLEAGVLQVGEFAAPIEFFNETPSESEYTTDTITESEQDALRTLANRYAWRAHGDDLLNVCWGVKVVVETGALLTNDAEIYGVQEIVDTWLADAWSGYPDDFSETVGLSRDPENRQD